jgi:small-conductance mechanosensitive channel
MNSDSILDAGAELYNDLSTTLVELLPKIVLALIVLLVGLILAWVIKRLARNFILYLNRSINEKLKNKSLGVDLNYTAVLISKTFYWFVIIFTVAIVTHILGLPVMTTWLDGIINYLPNILAGVIIVFIGIIVGKLVGDLISSGSSRSGISNAAQLGKFTQYTLLIISIFIAIDQVGIDIMFITIIFSIVLSALLFGAALAFGLGARSSVSNILGSYYLQKTYKEGDKIQMEDIEGIIIKITPTSVLVDTKSGQILIPAKDFNNKKTTLIRKN